MLEFNEAAAGDLLQRQRQEGLRIVLELADEIQTWEGVRRNPLGRFVDRADARIGERKQARWPLVAHGGPERRRGAIRVNS